MSGEHDVSGEDVEETLHPNENYDSGRASWRRRLAAAVAASR